MTKELSEDFKQQLNNLKALYVEDMKRIQNRIEEFKKEYGNPELYEKRLKPITNVRRYLLDMDTKRRLPPELLPPALTRLEIPTPTLRKTKQPTVVPEFPFRWRISQIAVILGQEESILSHNISHMEELPAWEKKLKKLRAKGVYNAREIYYYSIDVVNIICDFYLSQFIETRLITHQNSEDSPDAFTKAIREYWEKINKN